MTYDGDVTDAVPKLSAALDWLLKRIPTNSTEFPGRRRATATVSGHTDAVRIRINHNDLDKRPNASNEYSEAKDPA
jgi:hypothetical protein